MLNDLRNRPLPLALLAFIVGTLFGWWILGWVLFPVVYKDADPHGLSQSYQEQYIASVADSYAVNQDATLARQRLQSFSSDELSSLISKMKADAQRDRKDQQAVSLQRLADGLNVKLLASGTPAPAGTAAPGATAALPTAASNNSPLGLILGLLGLVLIIAGAAGILYFLLSRRQGAETTVAIPTRARESVSQAQPVVREQPGILPPTVPVAEAEPGERGEAPLGHFVTTYKVGDDGYDTSFSIETPSGEFLGECGVGISDVVGEGPQKVTAFEVWLFDKNEIKTVTKVLMSDHAYNNDQIRRKLAARGDAVHAQKGGEIELETEALRVLATVADMAYGSGGSPQSFFSKLTVELAPTVKVRVPA